MQRISTSFLACLGFLISNGLNAAPAVPLSSVEILKVASTNGAVEDVRGGQVQTRGHHRGPNIKVFVLERGYGGQPTVTFDGQEVDGVRTPVCNQGQGLVTCDGVGTTVGYVYTFDLGNKDGGFFQFSNTSLVPPHNRLSAQLVIQ